MVHSVGKNVFEFKPGDRVAAFHRMNTPGGAFAEYAVAPAVTTFHIPKTTSFEEAATIPLAAMTAALALFIRLDLPQPWSQGRQDGKEGKPVGPLLIYGAASAVGAYAIQLAKRANIGPIIAVAGRGIPFVQTMLGPEDSIVDYRKGNDSVVSEIKAALKGQKLKYTLDAVSDKGSFQNASKVMDGGHITLVLPGNDHSTIPSTIGHSITRVGLVYAEQSDFGMAWYRLFSKGLLQGWLKGHPYEVRGGLEAVSGALKDLKAGKNSGTKYIFKVADA